MIQSYVLRYYFLLFSLFSCIYLPDKAFSKGLFTDPELKKSTEYWYEVKPKEIVADESYFMPLIKKLLNTRDTSNELKAIIHSKLGGYFFRTGKTDSALYHFKTSIDLARKNDVTKILALSYGGAANMYGRKGKAALKLSYLDSALLVFERSNGEKSLRLSLLSDKANTLLPLNNEAEYLKIYYEVLDESIKAGLEPIALNAHLNLGIFYSNRTYKYPHYKDSALKYIEKSQLWIGNDQRDKALVYMNLGTLYGLDERKYAEGIDLLERSGDLFKEVKDTFNVSVLKYQLAHVYFFREDYRKSISLLKLVLDESNRHGFVQIEMQAFLKLYEAYKSWNKADSALHYYESFRNLKDSLYSASIDQKMIDLEEDFNIKQRDMKIQLLEKDHEIAQSKLKIFWWVAVLSSLVSVLAIVFFKTKRRLEAEKNNRLHEEVERKKLEQENTNMKILQQEKEIKITALTLSEKRSYLENLLAQINSKNAASSDEQIQSIKKSLKRNLEDLPTINEYLRFINASDPQFEDRLIQLSPNLTPREIRLASYVHSGLTNKEIAAILHTEENTVKVAKYRLKKKLFPARKEPLSQLLR